MSAASTPRQASSSPRVPSPRKWVWRAAAVAAGATVIVSLGAWAATVSPPAPPAVSASSPDHPLDRPGMGEHGHHHGMGGPEHGAELMPFSGPRLKHLLDEVKATDAQRAQIKDIADKAQVDLQALHEEGRKLHEQGLDLWASPKLDATLAEDFRQQMLKHHDLVSQRMTKAMLDVAKVLTPDQRANLVQRLREHHLSMLERMKAHMGWGQGRPEGHRPPPPPQGASAPASHAQ